MPFVIVAISDTFTDVYNYTPETNQAAYQGDGSHYVWTDPEADR